jgi:hypothetical protein
MAGVITFGALGMLTITLLLRWRRPAVRKPVTEEAQAEVLAH